MVLIVDDHADTAALLARVLRRAGIEAQAVTGGVEALSFMTGRVPALVILDVMMPDMNGIDVLRAMRRDDALRGVRVIMYSADAAYPRMREALRAGAHRYFVKGTIGSEQLVSEVRRLV